MEKILKIQPWSHCKSWNNNWSIHISNLSILHAGIRWQALVFNDDISVSGRYSVISLHFTISEGNDIRLTFLNLVELEFELNFENNELLLHHVQAYMIFKNIACFAWNPWTLDHEFSLDYFQNHSEYRNCRGSLALFVILTWHTSIW